MTTQVKQREPRQRPVKQVSSSAKLLLLEDIEELGRSGDIVSVRPGYARNFLLPQQKALIADANALRKQKQLQEARAQQAVVDRQISDALAARIQGMTVETEVKVDPEGHMYGSVSAHDIVMLLANEKVEIEKKSVRLVHPIKATGVHDIELRLKEGVTCSFKLKIIPEGGALVIEQSPTTEEATEQSTSES
jgi:large subunit ribosomal protein L9